MGGLLATDWGPGFRRKPKPSLKSALGSPVRVNSAVEISNLRLLRSQAKKGSSRYRMIDALIRNAEAAQLDQDRSVNREAGKLGLRKAQREEDQYTEGVAHKNTPFSMNKYWGSEGLLNYSGNPSAEEWNAMGPQEKRYHQLAQGMVTGTHPDPSQRLKHPSSKLLKMRDRYAAWHDERLYRSKQQRGGYLVTGDVPGPLEVDHIRDLVKKPLLAPDDKTPDSPALFAMFLRQEMASKQAAQGLPEAFWNTPDPYGSNEYIGDYHKGFATQPDARQYSGMSLYDRHPGVPEVKLQGRVKLKAKGPLGRAALRAQEDEEARLERLRGRPRPGEERDTFDFMMSHGT